MKKIQEKFYYQISKKTRPIAFDGRPNAKAIRVVTVEAINLHDIAFAKLLPLDSIGIFFP